MQNTKTTITLLITILMLGLAVSSLTYAGQFTAGVERYDCGDLKREIKRNWMQLQSFYEPKAEKLKKPKSSDLYCVAPAYKNHAFSKASASSEYRCYTMKGVNFCCDRSHKACVALK